MDEEQEAIVLAATVMNEYAIIKTKRNLKLIIAELNAVADQYKDKKVKIPNVLDGEVHQVAKIFEQVYRDVAARLTRLTI
jgi:hypothetical protein